MAQVDLGQVIGPTGPQGETGPQGPQGPQGEPGIGIAPGGLEGQMLIKASNQDYATEWGPWPSNPNLLLNWDFRNPVNRNGKSEYTDDGYTIDRWSAKRISLRCESESIIVQWLGTEGNGYIFQPIEIWDMLNGKVATFSLLADGDLISFTSTISSSYFASDLTNNIRLIFWGANKGLQISVQDTIEHNFQAAKLDLGDQQTLAHQDADGNWVLNEPPNFDLQYSLCSQYSPVTGEFIGSQHSNPNLLDNWYFADPINQRGQTEYINTVASHFQIIDRWAVNNLAHVSLQNGGMSFRKTGTYGTILCTIIENCPPAGETITLSALCKVNGGTFLLAFQDNAYNIVSIPITEEYTLVSITKKISGKPQWLGFRDISASNDSNNIHIKAAKLEIGDKQTLAHQDTEGNWVLNDPPPNKALELAKCQRYQFVTGGGNNKMIGVFDTGTASNKILTRIAIPLPTTMRKTTPAPRILGSGMLRLVQISPQIKAIGSIPSTAKLESTFLSNNYCYVTYETPELTAGVTGVVDTTNTSTYLCIDNNI